METTIPQPSAPAAPPLAAPIPVVQPQISAQDQRLENIINKGPPSAEQEAKGFLTQAKKFCFSKIGLAILTFIFLFLLLLVLRPSYIFKKSDDNAHSFKSVNYALLSAIALIGSLLVIVIPYFIVKKG